MFEQNDKTLLVIAVGILHYSIMFLVEIST